MTLIERLQAATGGSRELDAAIWWNVDRHVAQRHYWNAQPGLPEHTPDEYHCLRTGLGKMAVLQNAPYYTTNLQAAVSLKSNGSALAILMYPEGKAGAGLSLDGSKPPFVGTIEFANPAIAVSYRIVEAHEAKKAEAA